MSTLNIAAYHFVAISDPDATAAAFRAACDDLGLRGTILVASEGVNLFLAGPEAQVDAFLAQIRADERFATLKEKRSWSESVPFARTLVKVKPEIITFRQPVHGGAPRVSPPTLRRWLDQGHDDAGREVVLVDTRNDEELVYGTFRGAVRLGIRKFTQLPAALEAVRPQLEGKTVVTFCTGGIRCEKAAPWMLEHGVEGVTQLDGGVLAWFEQEGGAHYDGGCFVFDERICVDPDLSPTVGAARLVTRKRAV